MNRYALLAIVAAPMVAAAGEGRLAEYFNDLPEGTDPATISRLVTDQFLATRPENYLPAGYRGNKGYGWNKEVHYSVVSLWMNAIKCAKLTDDEYRMKRLVRLFDDFLPGGSKEKLCSRPWHVDFAIFGALPFEIYMMNKDKRCLDMGLKYADTQWCEPCEATFREKGGNASPDVQREYYAKGFSVQTRLWIDDMYMITALQSQAYRATGDRKYIERAAAEMIFYLDSLQLKDGPAKGLFYHAPDVPFVWGRGDGWMAAGMALLLDCLPEDSPHRARIMEGYLLMMKTLLGFQRPDGLWSQLVDRPDDKRNWGETSCTAMFAYAYIVGVSRGWLDGATYGPAARRAYLALCSRMDKRGNIADVCEGTGKRNDLEYYFKRKHVNGDPHAQAPMLWAASALMADGAGKVTGLRTPVTSKLFMRHVDPVSGVVSYVLNPGMLKFNQQSFYFTSKSMTDDGRFIMLDLNPDEKVVKETSTKTRRKAVVDLLKDEAFPLTNTMGSIPYLDVKRDQLWWVNAEGVHRRDLLVDPDKDIIVCPCPPELIGKKNPEKDRYGTHVTLSPDRKLMFLDSSADGVEKAGVINLETGKWEEWGCVNFVCDHGQFNPVDPTLAMCAMEYSWHLTRDEVSAKDVERAGMREPPYATKIPRPHEDIYPRLWLFRKGEFWMVPSKITNQATHETFAEDGKGFYWCSDGTYYHDLATDRQWCINPCSAAHAMMSSDNRFVAFDRQSDLRYCHRGCAWRVGFWNRDTHRAVYIHSKSPAITSNKEPSKMHPDAHPQFVCNDRYIICTLNDDKRRMNLSITPVDQLVALTSDPATAPVPKTFPIESWSPDLPQDAPFEFEIDVKSLRDRRLVAKPGCRVRSESYTPFSLMAEGSDGKCRPVPFEAVQSPAHQTRVILRFDPPKDAKKLFYVADAPGKFEYYDSESCANMFPSRIPHDLFPPKAAKTARPGEHTPMAVCKVPRDAAGKPVKFGLVIRNLAFQKWSGAIRLEMYDAQGKLLGDALGGRLAGKKINMLARSKFNEVGMLSKDADEVRLVVEGNNDDGSEARIQKQSLNLRVARVLPFAPPKK